MYSIWFNQLNTSNQYQTPRHLTTYINDPSYPLWTFGNVVSNLDQSWTEWTMLATSLDMLKTLTLKNLDIAFSSFILT